MVSFAGLGSGLDLNTLVNQLVSAERAPTAARLDRREAETQVRLSATASLRAELSKFRSSLTNLKTLSGIAQRTAASADTSVLTAVATSTAVPATYDIAVTTLAAAHRIASDGFEASTTTVGTGTLSFRFGTYTAGETVFTVDADRSTQTVTINSANQSLEGIRQAVNNANIGVKASIIDDGSGKRLLFQSTTTGAAGGLEVTADDDDLNDTDNSGLSQLVFSAATKNASTIVAGADAQLTIDGLNITRASNSITGAIEGVTLSLVDTGSSQLTIAANTAATDTAIRGMVSSYNDLTKLVNQLTLFDPNTGSRGAMLGDAAVRGIAGSVRRALTDSVSGFTGSVRSLVDIGITTAANGTISVDSTKLSAALADDFDGVAQLFALSGSTTDPLIRYVGATSDTVAGTYNVNVVSLGPTTGTINAASTTANGTALTGATGDTLGLTIDVMGGATGARGSVTVVRGIASRLNELLFDLMALDGPIDAKTTTLNRQTDAIQAQRVALDRRMTGVEARYRAQFSALDRLMANLQSTGSFLTRELANLPNSPKKAKT